MSKKYDNREITTGQIGDVESVCFSPDGVYIALGSRDGSVHVLDWENNKEVVELSGHKRGVYSVRFSPDGKHIVSGSGWVRVWDWQNNKELPSLIGHVGSVEGVNFSPNCEYIVSGSEDATIRVWDWKKNREIVKIAHREQFWSVDFSPDGKYIVSGSRVGAVRVWDWQKNREIAQLNDHGKDRLYAVFSPDGEYIASGSGDGDVCVWDWKKNREIAKLTGHTDSIGSIDFSSNGKYIVSGSYDKTVRVWDWKNESVVRLFSTEYPIYAAAFSFNNPLIVAGGEEGAVIIFGVEELDFSNSIVTPLKDLNNNLNIRCSYCGEVFGINDKDLGNFVKCANCEEKLKFNSFTVNPIATKDTNEVIGDKSNHNSGKKDISKKSVFSNKDFDNNASDKKDVNKNKKKGFFSRIFGR